MNSDFVERKIAVCVLCPRKCGAKRTDGKTGPCGAGPSATLAGATIHNGEEPPISGTKGSATFFFSRCPLHCKYCQNFPISQLGYGREISTEALAERMCRLSGRGAHNINIVTGTQFAPHIIEAVEKARSLGMIVPIVWNTSGYESPETIDLLNGTVDIYLTDIKYADNRTAQALSGVNDYVEVAVDAAVRMVEQVGPLKVDESGIGTKGVIIRHLVLPENLSRTETVMRTIVERIGVDVPVSLMGQYFPAHRAHEISTLCRPLSDEEYEAAEQAAVDAGIQEGWFQDMDDPTTRRGA